MRHVIPRRSTMTAVFSLVLALLVCQDVLAQEPQYEHLMFRAIRLGDVAVMADLLRRGTPPDVETEDGTTPLMLAALHGSAEMIELLLDHGADPRATNERGVTALLWKTASG